MELKNYWTLVVLCVGLLTVSCNDESDPDPLDGGSNDGGSDDGGNDNDASYDCDDLIQGPLEMELVPGPIASSEVLFDDEGNLVGSDDVSIFKTPFNGDPVEFVTGLDFRAGMAYLPDGHIMYADNVLGRLMRVDPEGQLHVVLTDLNDPNGIAVDLCGNVYVTDEGAGQVLRVDPYTGDFSMLVEGLSDANDLTFNVDYTRLYVGTFNEDDKTIYYIDIDIETGEHDPLTPWVTDLGSGFHDGLRVDACDNVYVCDYCCHGSCNDICIYRISADGIVEPQRLVDPPSVGIYIPNFDWGAGIGGWDNKTLFLPHGWLHHVYQLDIGVPSKPTVYP